MKYVSPAREPIPSKEKTMKGKLLVLLIAGALIGGAVQAYAHHSFAATYLDDKTAKLEGKLISFQLRNPHSFLEMDAPDEEGKMQRWAVEWGGAGLLNGQGISRDTLKPGDHIIITGNAGRNPEDHRMRLISLRRPSDNFSWGLKAGETVD
jgi:Family of unknown function (DUF6152)